MASHKEAFDPFQRGQKGFSLPGPTIMFLGRLVLNPCLQFAILATPLMDPLLDLLGISHRPAAVTSVSHISPTVLASLPLPRLLLLTFNCLVGVKMVYWAWFVSQEPVTVKFGFENTFINGFVDALMNVLYLCVGGAASVTGAEETVTRPMILAAAVALASLAVEIISERQRKTFKQDPRNKGKLFTGGLFAYARHVNYGAFALARAAHALFASGWLLAVVVLALFTWDLGFRAADILDSYCGERYGEQWRAYKRRVPYKLYPFLF